MTLPGRDALAARLHAFVDGSLRGAPPEPFERLCLDLHAWQAAHDPVIASLVERSPTRWHDVPAVPVDVYKHLPVGTVKTEDAPVVFRTSGTTGGGRGVHRLRDAALYDHGAEAWARRCVPDLPPDVVALLASPVDAPDSSLSHMVARLTPGTATWHFGEAGLDVDGLRGRLAGLDRPVWLATTAFALAEALDHPLPALPPGSLIMVTGGFKGRRAQVDETALAERAHATLRPRRIVTEYGMTELSSQLWGQPGEPYRAPPWLGVLAVDPATGAPVPRGAPGQLRFYDLCNLDSSVGVETMDVGVAHPDGAVELHGRLTDAPARGCSLTVEEAWQLRGGR